MSVDFRKYFFAAILLSGSFWGMNVCAEDGVSAVRANACEPVKEGEAKSSVRVRATDKASFKAVENIAALSDYRNKYPTHDFNVMVYKIVDNYLEDLAIRTTEQTAEKLCVEVTGYLQDVNVQKVINENLQKYAEAEEEKYPQELELENRQAALQPVVTELPPKPDISINDEISAETVLEEEDKKKHKAAAVYIAPTEFFNNTSTDAFQDEIRQTLETEKELAVNKDKTNADYIIKSKVLRAKVDPINSQTNRMQMVIAVELLDTQNGKSIIEHQNRFVLFESSENEQIVANSLMKKLLRQAVKKISPKIKGADKIEKAIITPPNAH